ncbi:SatD family protein [Bacillota bacterium Meth-B3]
MYCVIAGDMIASRTKDAATRDAILSAAHAAFERINREYASEVLVRFGMVRGDAFEGALRAPRRAPEIVQRIIKAFSAADDARVRIAAACGELTVVSADRNEADGPAFQDAFALIEQLKKNKSSHWLQVAIQADGAAQPLLDGMLGLLSALTEGWTGRQRQMAWAMDKASGQQKQVAQLLGVSRSTVSKQLKSAHYIAYREAWNRLTEYLTTYEGMQDEQICRK